MTHDSTTSATGKHLDMKTALAKATTKGKATVKASIAKDDQKQALQDNSPLKTREDMKGFLRQYPATGSLLGITFNVCRNSFARRPGHEGFWAAHPYPWWAKKADMSVATLKRHLDRLEQHGLIERQLGHHQGKRVLAFIRPTALALKLSNTRPNDREHFGIKSSKPAKAATTPAVAAKKPLVSEAEDKPMSKEEMMAILQEDTPLVQKKPPVSGDDQYVPQTLAEVMAIFNSED